MLMRYRFWHKLALVRISSFVVVPWSYSSPIFAAGTPTAPSLYCGRMTTPSSSVEIRPPDMPRRICPSPSSIHHMMHPALFPTSHDSRHGICECLRIEQPLASGVLPPGRLNRSRTSHARQRGIPQRSIGLSMLSTTHSREIPVSGWGYRQRSVG